MPKTLTLLLILPLFFSCKQEAEKHSEEPILLPTPQAIAHSYGIDHWDKVNEIRFTFNVDQGDYHSDRRFHWKPKTKEVTYISKGDTLNYTRGNELDSLQTAADQRFINDKYWLMVPYQLVWDPNLEFAEFKRVVAPISKDTLSQLTLAYPSDGGYTPGDAYDLYYDDDFRISEWTYRRGNQAEPNLITTWEDVEEHKGLYFATMHRDSLNSLQISFTDLYVE